MIFNLNTEVPYIKVDIVGERFDLYIDISGVNTFDAWSTQIDPKSKLKWNPEQAIKECVQIGRDNFSFYDYNLFVTFTTRFRENFKYLNEINLKYIEDEIMYDSLYDFYHSDKFKDKASCEFMGSFNKEFFSPPINPMDKGGKK